MKKLLVLISVVAGLLLCFGDLLGKSKKSQTPNQSSSSKKDSLNGQIVQELISALDKAKDKFEFREVLHLIVKLKPHARGAAPAIIRNLSRLGLTSEKDVVRQTERILNEILEKKGDQNGPILLGYSALEESQGSTEPANTKNKAERTENASLRELVEIMNHTQSADTFLIALALVTETGAKARPFLPDVLKNAERLNILSSYAFDGDGDSAEKKIAGKVAEAIESIYSDNVRDNPLLHDSSKRSYDPYYASFGRLVNTPPCNLSPKDKQKKVSILIVPNSSVVTPQAKTEGAAGELARRLRRRMLAEFQKNGTEATIISINQVEKYQAQRECASCTLEDLAKHFHADYVVAFDIKSFDVNADGWYKDWLRGKTAVSLSVRDMKDPEDDLIYEEFYEKAMTLKHISPEKFRQSFFQDVANELSSRFVPTKIEGDRAR